MSDANDVRDVSKQVGDGLHEGEGTVKDIAGDDAGLGTKVAGDVVEKGGSLVADGMEADSVDDGMKMTGDGLDAAGDIANQIPGGQAAGAGLKKAAQVVREAEKIVKSLEDGLDVGDIGSIADGLGSLLG